MAWNKNQLELDEALCEDIPGWCCIGHIAREDIIDWILNDRTQKPQWKAEARIKRKDTIENNKLLERHKTYF